MFPNLRLIIGATVATMILVMVMGSGLLSFRDPQAGFADIPVVRRPLVQRAIVAEPDRQRLQMLAYARRSDELQRLLDLPVSPVKATLPSVTASYPFDVKPAVETVAVPLPAEAPATEAAAPAPVPADTVVAALAPSEPDPVSPVPSAPAAAPEPSQTNSAAPAKSAGKPETPVAPLAALTGEPDDGPAPDAKAVPGSVPESAIPAIERAPLPRLDPRATEARDPATSATTRPVQRRTIKKRAVRTVRLTRPRPSPPAAAAPAQAERPLPSLYDRNGFDTRNGVMW